MGVGALAVRHEPASAALVRSAIAADLEQQAIAPSTVDDVVLVASELIGNAVIHTDSTVDDLDVSWNVVDDAVLVEVCDGSDQLPQRRANSDTAPSGRGLAIVAALSADWGVRRTSDGKRVWAKILVTHRG